MKSKILCQKIEAIPSSREEGAPSYFKTTFKRVGDVPKRRDEETLRVMKEHPSVRVEFCTWEKPPFVPGKDYVIEITEYPYEEKVL